MPNEGSYGGFISVRKDGSVEWQIAERTFPENRDTDGTLEYAIRVVAPNRSIFTSKDGKCLIDVNVDAEDSRNRPQHQKFLIVSGYEAPLAGERAIIVGRSYYVTAGHYTPDQPIGHYHKSTPRYDLTLRYDDYDLDRAGLPLDLEPDKLSLCHQNWVSVRTVMEQIERAPESLYEEAGISKELGQQVRASLKLNELSRDVLFAWADLERAMREAGMNSDLKDILLSLLKNAKDHGAEQSDVRLSRWRRVKIHKPEQDDSAKDALSSAIDGKPIITALSIAKIAGSRSISAKGLIEEGTFALMYHGDARISSTSTQSSQLPG